MKKGIFYIAVILFLSIFHIESKAQVYTELWRKHLNDDWLITDYDFGEHNPKTPIAELKNRGYYIVLNREDNMSYRCFDDEQYVSTLVFVDQNGADVWGKQIEHDVNLVEKYPCKSYRMYELPVAIVVTKDQEILLLLTGYMNRVTGIDERYNEIMEATDQDYSRLIRMDTSGTVIESIVYPQQHYHTLQSVNDNCFLLFGYENIIKLNSDLKVIDKKSYPSKAGRYTREGEYLLVNTKYTTQNSKQDSCVVTTNICHLAVTEYNSKGRKTYDHTYVFPGDVIDVHDIVKCGEDYIVACEIGINPGRITCKGEKPRMDYTKQDTIFTMRAPLFLSAENNEIKWADIFNIRTGGFKTLIQLNDNKILLAGYAYDNWDKLSSNRGVTAALGVVDENGKMLLRKDLSGTGTSFIENVIITDDGCFVALMGYTLIKFRLEE